MIIQIDKKDYEAKDFRIRGVTPPALLYDEKRLFSYAPLRSERPEFEVYFTLDEIDDSDLGDDNEERAYDYVVLEPVRTLFKNGIKNTLYYGLDWM